MKISTMIKKLTKPKGPYTYRELANKLKVTERTLYRYMEGSEPPGYQLGKKLERMCTDD